MPDETVDIKVKDIYCNPPQCSNQYDNKIIRYFNRNNVDDKIHC